MKKLALATLFALAVFLPSAANAQTTWSLGYYFPSAVPSPISAIQWSGLTHVSMVGGNPNSNASITLASGFSSDAPALITAAHANGVKVLYSLTNLGIGGTGWAGAATGTCGSGNLQTFISNIMSTVNSYGFDGVDLDWEETYDNTKIGNLVACLRTALGTKLLTADNTSAASCATPGASYTPAIIANLDRIAILTYDLNGSWNPETWFNAPLFSPGGTPLQSVDSDIAAVTACSYPLAKVSIGIPFYGYLQSPSNGPYQAFGASPSLTQFGYNDMLTMYGLGGSTYDGTAHSPWRALNGTSWIQWDNAQSITDKINYVHTNSLGGWVIWVIGWDYSASASPKEPLLAAVAQALTPAGNIYVGQSATGSGAGSDCSNTLAYTYFNTSGNWGTGPSQIGPGTTVHICGTITGATGADGLVFHGSGTSGNLITVVFESGAIMTSPRWGGADTSTAHGAIVASGQSFIKVDLGANGIIQNTLNGTAGGPCLGGTCTQRANSTGIGLQSVSNVIVTASGGAINHIYDHTSLTDGDPGAPSLAAVWCNFTCSNVTVNGLSLTDAQVGIYFVWTGASSNDVVSNNTITRMAAGIIAGDNSGSSTLTNFFIFGNKIHDFFNWNTNTDAFHNDGIHVWANQTGSKLVNLEIFNNYFYGAMGGNGTAWVYFQNDAATASTGYVFNNIFDNLANVCNDSFCGPHIIEPQAGNMTVGIYNNDVLGNGVVAAGVYIHDSSMHVSYENNIASGYTDFIFEADSLPFPNPIDYNAYFNGQDVGALSIDTIGGYNRADFLAGSWHAQCVSSGGSSSGCDAHSIASAVNLNASTYVPNAGSPVIAAATNLTSLCGTVAALCFDSAGVARPAVGAWDMGARQSGSAPPPPPPAPTGLQIISVF